MRRAHQIGDERSQAVVVTVANLFVRDGVIFIDNRHDVERGKRGERSTSVEILRTIRKIEWRKQHLTDRDALASEGVSPRLHQQWLAHRRDCLQRRGVVGTWSSRADTRPPRRNRARGDDDDRPTVGSRGHDVVGDRRQHVRGDASDGVGDRRRTNLYNNATHRHLRPRPRRDDRVEPSARAE